MNSLRRERESAITDFAESREEARLEFGLTLRKERPRPGLRTEATEAGGRALNGAQEALSSGSRSRSESELRTPSASAASATHSGDSGPSSSESSSA